MTRDRDTSFPMAPVPVPHGAPWLDAWRQDLDAHGSPPLAQAATVAPWGDPEVRTVVVRGVTLDGGPVFTSDARSAKARAILAGSAVAVCVWWPERGIQVRLRGPATFVADAEAARADVRGLEDAKVEGTWLEGVSPGGTSPDDAWRDVRARLWRGHRETERRGFAGPPPGTPWEPSDPSPAPGPDEPPHANFGVVIVTPHGFDRLVLGDPHVRTRYRWCEDRGWDGGRVTP